MFRPGNLGHLGRLGLVAASRPSLVAQALAILAKYGSAANLYLPGVGAISGLQAGNWLDGIGATAATVDNPVGLVVSAGKAVGPELVTNGDFSNGTTGWTRGNTGTQTIESGALRVAGDGATTWSGISETTIPALTKGKQYLVQFSVLAENTSSGAGLYFRTSSLSIGGIFTNGLDYFYPSAVGNYSILYTATVDNINNLRIIAGVESNASVLFDNISVRELPGGAHLTQSTAANRPILRRGLVNLLTQSDFQNGLTDAPTRGGLVTASTLAGYGGALAFGHNGATASYAYKAFSAIANTRYTLVAVVKMDDSGAPTFGNSDPSSAQNTFAIVCQGDAINPLSYTKAQLADGCWLVCASYSRTVAGINMGVVKYAQNNSRTFRVTRYGLFVGQHTAQQIIAAGGTPITTTAPASSASGPFAWQCDGSNDSFTSTLTPGNAGFFCASANVTDSGVLRTLLGAGAGSDASSGVWLARQVSSNLLMLMAGNGTARNSIGAPYPVATNAVASAGWDSSAMFVGINNTETSGAKTVDCTSSNTMNLGVLTGTTNPMLGTIGATIIMPTVLPTATERATLRQFIASLSGVTM